MSKELIEFRFRGITRSRMVWLEAELVLEGWVKQVERREERPYKYISTPCHKALF